MPLLFSCIFLWVVAPCHLAAATGTGRSGAFVADTRNLSTEQLRLTTGQSYDRGSRQLELSAQVRRANRTVVSSASPFAWRLNRVSGAAISSGNMAWNSSRQEWMGGQTLSSALASGSYSVVYSFTPTTGGISSVTGSFVVAGGGELSGRINDASTRAPVSGAVVSIAGKSSNSNAQGVYSTSGVDPAAGLLMRVQKSGYATSEYNIRAPSSGALVVRDVALHKQQVSKPVPALRSLSPTVPTGASAWRPRPLWLASGMCAS